jgi:hypothetical protein
VQHRQLRLLSRDVLRLPLLLLLLLLLLSAARVQAPAASTWASQHRHLCQ